MHGISSQRAPLVVFPFAEPDARGPNYAWMLQLGPPITLAPGGLGLARLQDAVLALLHLCSGPSSRGWALGPLRVSTVVMNALEPTEEVRRGLVAEGGQHRERFVFQTSGASYCRLDTFAQCPLDSRRERFAEAA